MTGLKGPVTMKAKVTLMQRLLKIREKTSNNQQVDIQQIKQGLTEI